MRKSYKKNQYAAIGVKWFGGKFPKEKESIWMVFGRISKKRILIEKNRDVRKQKE